MSSACERSVVTSWVIAFASCCSWTPRIVNGSTANDSRGGTYLVVANHGEYQFAVAAIRARMHKMPVAAPIAFARDQNLRLSISGCVISLAPDGLSAAVGGSAGVPSGAV